MPYCRYFLASLLAGLASAFPQSSLNSRQVFTGIATFNDFSSQPGTVCGPKSGIPGTFGAAASSISPDLAPGTCDFKVDTSLCSGQAPKASYAGPSCSKSNCGVCYTVTNAGGTNVQGTGKTVTVQIIDSCPATSAFNYCKTNIPANERCGDGTTNQLDIDKGAYFALTGIDTGPNLKITISPVTCPDKPGAPPAAPAPASPPANPAPPNPPEKLAPANPPPPNPPAKLAPANPPPPNPPAKLAPANPPPPNPPAKLAPANPPPTPPAPADVPPVKQKLPSQLEPPVAHQAASINKTIPLPAGNKIAQSPEGKATPAPGRVMLVWQNGTKAWGLGS